jgi:hypothetical protein
MRIAQGAKTGIQSLGHAKTRRTFAIAIQHKIAAMRNGDHGLHAPRRVVLAHKVEIERIQRMDVQFRKSDPARRLLHAQELRSFVEVAQRAPVDKPVSPTAGEMAIMEPQTQIVTNALMDLQIGRAKTPLIVYANQAVLKSVLHTAIMWASIVECVNNNAVS